MTAQQEALHLFEEHKVLRTREALALGIHPRTLYALRDSGAIEPLSRGLYALAERPALAQPDFIVVASKVEMAIIGFVSALAFHDLTTQVPHAVHVALPAFWHEPNLDYPPLTIYRVSEPAYSVGVEQHTFDSVTVPIYDAEKTIADVFKFRNRVGQDVAMEALKRYLEWPDRKLDRLLAYAELCRVATVLRPYLEALA